MLIMGNPHLGQPAACYSFGMRLLLEGILTGRLIQSLTNQKTVRKIITENVPKYITITVGSDESVPDIKA